MEIIYKKISELIPYARNNKIHNDRQIKLIASSILEFGFKQPIVVDSKNSIVAGHGRLKGAKLAGLEEVPCIIADDLTKAQIKAYRIADNKLSDLAEWDNEMIGLELEELGELDFDISLTGFDEIERISFDDFKDGKNDNVVGLNEKYIVPPFSVLDTKQGYWQDRKKKWREIIEDDGKSRGCVIGENFGISLLDPVLSELIIKWYAPLDKENEIFDCFAGDTVFGFVSSYKNNKFTGIELRQEQVDFNNKTTTERADYICDDGRNVIEHIKEDSKDLFFSCPPYYDLEVYSEKENDASNQETYEEFYEILDVAFKNSIKCLKDNRFAVVVAGDVRNKKTGEYYDFITDIKNTFKNNGMKLYNDLILLDPIGTAALRANKFSVSRKNVKIHQNVLVFYKGDTNNIKKEFYNIQEVYFESDDME